MDTKKKMDGLKLEYAALRDEIICLQNAKDLLVTTMYAVSLTIFGLVFEFRCVNLLFLEYIVLMVLQAYMNTKTMKLAKCGAYIKVNIESRVPGMQWEHINMTVDAIYRKKYMLTIGNREWLRIIRRHGSVIFALVALCTYTIMTISVADKWITLSMHTGIKITMCLIFTAFIGALDFQGSKFYVFYERYESILTDLNSKKNNGVA